MSTSKQFTVRKHFPTKFKVSAYGYYDSIVQKIFDNSSTETINLSQWTIPNVSYTASEYCPGVVGVDSGDFPDHTFRSEDSRVLMPYDNGKVYKDVRAPILNYNLENVGCTITNGVASGFSSGCFLHIKNIALRGNWEICLKVNVGEIGSSEQALFGQLSQNYHTPQIELSKSSLWLGLSSNGTSWNLSSSSYAISPELQENSEHIIKLTFDGEKYQAIIDDTIIATINNSTPIYVDDNEFVIGLDANNTSFPGTVDLNNSHIIADNVTLWEYPQTVLISKSMQGCLITTESGSSHTFKSYTIKNGGGQRLVLADSKPSLANSKVYYLKDVVVPSHDSYSYSETIAHIEQLPDDFVVVGNPTINGPVVSGFDYNTFVRLNTSYNKTVSSVDIQAKFIASGGVTDSGRFFNDTASFDNFRLLVYTPNGQDQTLVLNPSYTFFFTNLTFEQNDIVILHFYTDDGKLKFRYRINYLSWQNGGEQSFSPQTVAFGGLSFGHRAYSQDSVCRFGGTIDFSESWIRFDDDVIFTGYTEKGVWTKQT